MKKLPHLPLHKETKHISQEMADNIFDCLEENYTDWLENLDIIHDKGGSLHPVDIDDSYFRIADYLIDNSEAFPSFNKNELTMLDIVFELRRRYLTATGYPLPEVKGKPLAVSPEGPFPEKLVEKLIHKDTKKVGLSQKETDFYIAQFYKENKDFCYAQGEKIRRDFGTFFTVTGQESYFSVFEKMNLINDSSKQVKQKKTNRLRNELDSRISLTCELTTIFRLKKIEDGYALMKNGEWRKL